MAAEKTSVKYIVRKEIKSPLASLKSYEPVEVQVEVFRSGKVTIKPSVHTGRNNFLFEQSDLALARTVAETIVEACVLAEKEGF